jgi:hypothetical protein
MRQGALYPNLRRLREVARRIAVAVIRETARAGLVEIEAEEVVEQRVEAAMWEPLYPMISGESAVESA